MTSHIAHRRQKSEEAILYKNVAFAFGYACGVMKNIFESFDKGRLVTGMAGNAVVNVSTLPWNPHKEFAGVFLKNIVTAEMTGGLFTCHLVRIEAGCKIGLHTHPAQVELHEVMAGEGMCIIDGKAVPYAAGCVTILPRNVPHEVLAGSEGLCMFAKFIAARA